MRDPYRQFAVWATALAAVLIAAFVLVLGAHWYPAWIAAWSVVTFAFYGLDKRWARQGDVRIPEMVLHGTSLVGGFPGGWAGRSFFRHKTLHQSFTVVLIVATALNAGFAIWWFLLR